MTIKLDKLDLRILEQLDNNVRSGARKIAQNLSVGRQVVAYRIKRMEEQGVLINYRMLANFPKLGFPYYYRLHIKLDNLRLKEREKFVAYLISYDKSVWVAECDGAYDLLISFVGHTVSEIQTTIFDLVARFSTSIKQYDYVHVTDLEVPVRDFLGEKRLRPVKGNIAGQASPEKLTVLDKKMIHLLAQNGRKSVVDIAKEVCSSAERVNYRLKHIMKKGLLFSNFQLGYSVFHYELYKVLLYLKKPDRKRVDALKRFARSYPRIFDVVETLGRWQLELDIEAASHEDYYAIMDVFVQKFDDILDHYETLFVRKERKYLFSGYQGL